MKTFDALKRLARACDGSMVIETGIVASTLALLSLGSFQVSRAVARQNELEGAANEAAAIALAAKPDTTAKLATVKTILMTSTGLPTNKVTVSFRYRCGNSTTVTSSSSGCDNNGANKLWTFVRIQLTDTFNPTETHLGISSSVHLSVDRTVQIQ